eukprot:SAG31_NODE_31509_length_367_cov_0.955224_2_plen_35_part_01
MASEHVKKIKATPYIPRKPASEFLTFPTSADGGMS